MARLASFLALPSHQVLLAVTLMGVAACARSDAIGSPEEASAGPSGGGADGRGGGEGGAGGGPGAGAGDPSGSTATSSSGGGQGSTSSSSAGEGGTGGSAACGDGAINGDEVCDGEQLDGATCADVGESAGLVVCDEACELDFSGCGDAVSCENGVDDDEDGLVDAADPACAGAGDDDEAVVTPSCDGAGGPVVDLTVASGVPIVRSGTTVGAPADLTSTTTASCPTTPGPEVAFRLVLPEARSLLFSLDNAGTAAGWDPVLYVRSASCVGAQVGCNDDGGGSLKSELVVSAMPPGTYFVFVDSASTSGSFELTVTEL